MNELKIFNNAEFGSIRTAVINNEPYLVGKDVAEALGYTDAFGALKKHVDSEDKLNCQNDSFKSNRGMTVINESGVYSLVFSSKLPTAKKFKHWVTSEVLPSIRKTGGYIGNTDNMTDMEILARAVQISQRTIEEKEGRIKELEEQHEQQKPKVLFADSVSASETSILIGELAKLLKQNGVDIGEKRLFQWLRDNKYLISRKGTDYNVPTQKSMDLGLFSIKETVINHSDGHTSISKTTKVKGKGQVYFINKFLSLA